MIIRHLRARLSFSSESRANSTKPIAVSPVKTSLGVLTGSGSGGSSSTPALPWPTSPSSSAICKRRSATPAATSALSSSPISSNWSASRRISTLAGSVWFLSRRQSHRARWLRLDLQPNKSVVGNAPRNNCANSNKPSANPPMPLELSVLEKLEIARRLVAEALGRAPQLYDCRLDQALLVLELSIKRAHRSPHMRLRLPPNHRGESSSRSESLADTHRNAGRDRAIVRPHQTPGLNILDYLDTPGSGFFDYQDTSLPKKREPEHNSAREHD